MKILLFFACLLISFSSLQAQKFQLQKHPEAKELEPTMDSLTVYLHVNSYHKKYIDQLNKAIAGTPDTALNLQEILLNATKRSDVVRNCAGGHYNHALFWDILSTKTGTVPSDALGLEIKRLFYSQDSLKTLMSIAASKRFGGGWVWLMVTADKRLKITTTADEENPLMDKTNITRGIPIMGIDLWEHAYFLQYHENRKDYFQAVWKLIDWEAVSKKYAYAVNSNALKELNANDWPAFRKFHEQLKGMTMNLSKGEIQPIKSGSAELLSLAKALETEPIPSAYSTDIVKNAIKVLITACSGVNEAVVKKATDAVIKEKMSALREPNKTIINNSVKEDVKRPQETHETATGGSTQ